MLIFVMHYSEEEVFWFTILSDVHHSRLILRSRYWEFGDVGDIIWGSIVDRHFCSLLFMLINRNIRFLFLPRKKKAASSLGGKDDVTLGLPTAHDARSLVW
jgi:hypothetical protein